MATTNSTWLKLKEVLDELHISRTTFDLWKTDGRGPRCYKLPNGQYRIRRIDFEAWINTNRKQSLLRSRSRWCASVVDVPRVNATTVQYKLASYQVGLRK